MSTFSDWISKLILALIAAFLGSILGRHYERKRVLRERAHWLGYESPCEIFDEDDLAQLSRSPNPLCIRCGFRFDSHGAEVREVREKIKRNGTPIQGVPITHDRERELTPIEVPTGGRPPRGRTPKAFADRPGFDPKKNKS